MSCGSTPACSDPVLLKKELMYRIEGFISSERGDFRNLFLLIMHELLINYYMY